MTTKYVVVGNEAVIGVDYQSFILKYSCAQYENKGKFVVKGCALISRKLRKTEPNSEHRFTDTVVEAGNDVTDRQRPQPFR